MNKFFHQISDRIGCSELKQLVKVNNLYNFFFVLFGAIIRFSENINAIRAKQK